MAVGLAAGIAVFWLWSPAGDSQQAVRPSPTDAFDATEGSQNESETAADPAVRGNTNGAGEAESIPADLNRSSDESRPVIRIQVLNGCGRKRLAKWLAPALRAKGFDVRETSNAAHFNYAKTLVYDRTGVLDNGLRLADSLGIEAAQVSTELSSHLVDIDVTLIVGADYESLSLDAPEKTEEAGD
ncbi:MAG: LytR C-terminal domain-containing protein [bacterium]|nr:LytR C-terminal domain-containing protein [bacterium]